MRHFELCGHRGARGLWPENTLPGFAAAAAIGVDAIECDVTACADGTLVVVHDLLLDPDLVRDARGRWLARPIAVKAMALADLRRMDVGRSRPGSAVATRHPRQRPLDGTPIPTLAEVFQLLAPGTVRLDVELKTDAARPDIAVDPIGLVEGVMALAALHGVLDRLALRSFDWRGLLHARRRWPSVPLCFLTEGAGGEIAPGPLQPGDAWGPAEAQVTPAMLQTARARRWLVKPWTVNDPARLRSLIAMGVDGVCTDDPDIARSVMRDLEQHQPRWNRFATPSV